MMADWERSTGRQNGAGFIHFSPTGVVSESQFRWNDSTALIGEPQGKCSDLADSRTQMTKRFGLLGSAMRQILVTHWRSPGDHVCLTACIRDLALTYPGQFEIHVGGSHPELWENNPYVSNSWGLKPPGKISRFHLASHDVLRWKRLGQLHYLTAFHRELGDRLGIFIPVLQPQGDLHLTAEEMSTPLVKPPYWLIVSGGKSDIPVKIWSLQRYQETVNRLLFNGIRCVQAGATFVGHRHPLLQNVESLIGQTNLREFLRLVHFAEGVICGVSFPMHVAAALKRPCVVIAGGREPWWWEAYLNSQCNHFGPASSAVPIPHQYLHSTGQLDCCRFTGCWKTHLTGSQHSAESSICERPVGDGFGQTIPECMRRIKVDDVISAVSSLSQYSADPSQRPQILNNQAIERNLWTDNF